MTDWIDFQNFLGLGAWSAPAIIALRVALIGVAAWIAAAVLNRLIRAFRVRIARQFTEREQVKRAETIGRVLRYLVSVVLTLVAGVLILSELGVSIAPILGAAGVVGLAIGFGAQSLVKDFFSGFFIIFENQFSIGDEVVIAGHTGTVERMTLRTTTLRDTGGSIHIVPNGKIESVTIVAREWARVAVDVTVPYGEDLAKALDVVARAAASYAEQHPDTLLDDAPTIGVQDLGPRGATIRLAVKTAQGRHLGAARDLRRAVVLALYEAQVRLAHPREE